MNRGQRKLPVPPGVLIRNLMETNKSSIKQGTYALACRCCLALLASFAFALPLQAQDVPPTFFGGIQVNEPDHDGWVAALADAGLDSVQVTLYARQQRWDGSTLYWEREAPWVVSEIRSAKRAGLRVMLVMRVALEHGLAANRHLWHGMIWPRDDELQAWFDRYTEFVLWGAALAAREDVDLFVVGNELNSLSSTTAAVALPHLYAYFLDSDSVRAVRSDLVRCAATTPGNSLTYLDGGRPADLESFLLDEERVRRAWTLQALEGSSGSLVKLNARRARYEAFWRKLVAQVRGRYSGLVSYGANFDQFAEVGFWDALDFVAVNAYFPLSVYGLEAEGRVARMDSAWRRIAAELAEAGNARPVVLIELGWTRRLGSTVRPYSYDRVEVLETAGAEGARTCVHWESQPDDAGERVAALQALADVVHDGGFTTLRGFTLWKLTTRDEHRAIEPFAALLQPGSGYGHVGWQALASSQQDELDAAYVGLAAAIGREVRSRSARWHNSGKFNLGDRQE